MMRLGIQSILAGLLVILADTSVSRGETATEPPDFKEVYEIIRAHLPDISQPQLERAAVIALVSALSPRVILVSGEPEAARSGPLLSRVHVFDGDIAYLRIERVENGLAEAVRKSCESLAATNKLKGLVLDLRYTAGTDYAAAADVADVFLSKERPLLNWGRGMVKSKEKADALTLPVATLVNHQTSRAAEALAAVVRETGAGLVLGNPTAGQAMIAQEFPLRNGERLRIATAPIQVGEGATLTAEGLKPDITVKVSPEEERGYYADAFRAPPSPGLLASAGLSSTNQSSGTNRARRTRYNETELLRERREGPFLEANHPARREYEPEKALVHDPALARALDLLKGLAVVRQSRS